MVITGIASFIGKQSATIIAKKFGSTVVERWTRHRAEIFFNGFVEAISKEICAGIESKEVDTKLDSILNDDKQSEVLFDAYRSVCFSKSKNLGPRIIGLLTGTIVLEKRICNDSEEQVFKAAEILSDSELIGFFKNYRGYLSQATTKKKKDEPFLEGNTLIVPWSEEHRDSNWQSNEEIDISHLDMHEALGPWAASLEKIGILASKMTHRRVEYEEDGERHIDQNGIIEIYSFSVLFHSEAKLLSELIERALGASEVNS